MILDQSHVEMIHFYAGVLMHLRLIYFFILYFHSLEFRLSKPQRYRIISDIYNFYKHVLGGDRETPDI